MSQAAVLEILDHYTRLWGQFPFHPISRQTASVDRFRDFVQSTPLFAQRETVEGHLTGSAMVLDPDFRVLLTHHRKLEKWLQLGGHADGDSMPHRVALREAEEESGLKDLQLLGYEQHLFGDSMILPFDVDIHRIPERKQEPEHFHYDLRYLIVTDQPAQIVISEESTDLRWFTLEEAKSVTTEISMHRQFAKLEWLKEWLTDSPNDGKSAGFETSDTLDSSL